MENPTENPDRGLSVSSILVRVGQWFYGTLFWMALAIQILFSIVTWNSTVTYDYFCGNPLMSYWAEWFVISLVAGLLILPMGMWSIRHRSDKRGVFFLIGFSLYLLSVTFMLIAGVIFGTVPDFIDFIGYAFG